MNSIQRTKPGLQMVHQRHMAQRPTCNHLGQFPDRLFLRLAVIGFSVRRLGRQHYQVTSLQFEGGYDNVSVGSRRIMEQDTFERKIVAFRPPRRKYDFMGVRSQQRCNMSARVFDCFVTSPSQRMMARRIITVIPMMIRMTSHILTKGRRTRTCRNTKRGARCGSNTARVAMVRGEPVMVQ